MRRLTFRAQLTMNILTVLFVGLIVTTSTLARSGTGAILGQTTQTSTTTISYQGQLTNSSGQPLSATLPMSFALYTTPTGGTAVWTETRSGANAVPVANGLFSMLLGSVTPLDPNLLNQDLWLGISVDGDAEMTPREKLGSVPYAVRAGSVPDGSITQAKAPSLLKVAATQSGGGQNWKFQTGNWCISVNAGQYTSVDVTFPESFGEAPHVFATANNIAVGETPVHVSVHSAPTTTTSKIWVYSGVAQRVCGEWIAFGR